MDLYRGRSLRLHEIATLLVEARARTLLLVAPLSDEELRVQHDPLMSPVVWDLGHIAHFEEVWLLEQVEGGGPGSEGLRGMYNPTEHPRSTREGLPLPDFAGAVDELARVRRAVMERLPGLPLEGDGPLLRDGFVFRMVLQHEYQHGETILQTLQLKRGHPYPAPRALTPPRPDSGADPRAVGAMVRFSGGEVTIGTDDSSEAYDNERPAHERTVAPFEIDVAPVTSGDFLRFMEDGGYRRRELWADEGWAWLRDAGVQAPRHWSLDGAGDWRERFLDRERAVDPRRPVCHVCYWEADAYARWAGKRLPTEIEWETAALWDAELGRARRFPWGDEPATPLHANVDQLAFDTAPVCAYPANVSPLGCVGMIGDVWEWTSSDFEGYPGFESFPYPEYSEVHFGSDYKVLRGGSWATRPGALRGTFRNWDYPIRRQIFAGFRCARDG
jgi:iron(II)-dependent oxidoreductase